MRALRAQAGFTLIELLIVVVIIGILAAIAIPKFASTKEQAVVANMKSDLRNLISAEEGYFYENSTYYGGAVPDGTGAFKSTSQRDDPYCRTRPAPDGRQKRAIRNTARKCYVYYGTGGPVGPAVADGQVACT